MLHQHPKEVLDVHVLLIDPNEELNALDLVLRQIDEVHQLLCLGYDRLIHLVPLYQNRDKNHQVGDE